MQLSNQPMRASYAVPPAAHGELHGRKIGNIILRTFNHACEQGNLEIAGQLLGVYEMMVSGKPISIGTERRREKENLISAHDRLWGLLRASIA